MRILHIVKVGGIGGAERHLLDLLPSLRDRGVDARICVLSAGQHGPFVEALAGRKISARVVPARSDLSPTLVSRLIREIRDTRPDIVHTHLIHADLHGQIAASQVGVASVSSVHGAHVYRRRLVRRVATTWTRRSAATIAISEHVALELRRLRLVRPGEIRVIPYGIDGAPWLLTEAERAAARREFSIGEDDVAVGIASRLIEGKGHAILLRALREALPGARGLRLTVAGDGPLRAELETRAADLIASGSVRFTGFLDDVRAFLGACEVLVVPTLPRLGEGFGLVALEAMAAGRPVVASSVGSLPEVVSDGETGFLVHPGSVDELAARLALLGGDRDLRSRLGLAGRSRALTEFSLHRMVMRTMAVYEEVAGAGQPARAGGRDGGGPAV